MSIGFKTAIVDIKNKSIKLEYKSLRLISQFYGIPWIIFPVYKRKT